MNTIDPETIRDVVQVSTRRTTLMLFSPNGIVRPLDLERNEIELSATDVVPVLETLQEVTGQLFRQSQWAHLHDTKKWFRADQDDPEPPAGLGR